MPSPACRNPHSILPVLLLAATIPAASCSTLGPAAQDEYAAMVDQFADIQVHWIGPQDADFVGIGRHTPRRHDMTIPELGEWLSLNRSVVWAIGDRTGSFPLPDDEAIVPIYSSATRQIVTVHRSEIQAYHIDTGATKRLWSNSAYSLGRAPTTVNNGGSFITTTAYNAETDADALLGCTFVENGQSLITTYPSVRGNFDDVVYMHGATAFTIAGGLVVMFDIAGIRWGWERYHVTGGESKQPPWSTAEERITIVGAGDQGPVLARYSTGKPLPRWKDPYAIWMAGRWLKTGATSMPTHARSCGGRTWIIADLTIRCVETGEFHRVSSPVGTGTTDCGVWMVDSDFVLWRGEGDSITSTPLPIKLRK